MIERDHERNEISLNVRSSNGMNLKSFTAETSGSKHFNKINIETRVARIVPDDQDIPRYTLASNPQSSRLWCQKRVDLSPSGWQTDS